MVALAQLSECWTAWIVGDLLPAADQAARPWDPNQNYPARVTSAIQRVVAHVLGGFCPDLDAATLRDHASAIGVAIYMGWEFQQLAGRLGTDAFRPGVSWAPVHLSRVSGPDP